MTARNKGLASGQQTLVWDAQNRLSQVQDNNGNLFEQYWYDVDGSRVKKTRGTTTTYTFFAHYEEEVSSGVTTAISHYSLGSLRIAVKRGSTLYHLHGDHLGSTSLTTAGSVVEASRAYYAYGAERSASGTLQTDRTFTGQKSDATGLFYYNARYYDPTLGTFISPDSLVPDAGMVVDYNRFLYARGNPLKYSDPSGYIPTDLPEEPPGTPPGADPWVVDFYWKNRWYNARGFARGADGHWSRRIRPRYEDQRILREVKREDLIGWLIREMKGNLQDSRLKYIAQANKVSEVLLQEHNDSWNNVRIGAYGMWALLVAPGRDWDYKSHIEQAVGYWSHYGGERYFYDIWANINYGYTGRAASLGTEELLFGAGLVQSLVGNARIEYGLQNYYDDPSDQASIRIGMALYDRHGLQVNRANFRLAFQQEAYNLTRTKGDEYRIP